MNTNDLKPGDLLLFGTDHSILDALICLLLKSKVCHAALYMGGEVLADAAGSGIKKHPVQDGNGDPKQRHVFVRRLDKNMPMEPVLKAADVYVAEGNAYNSAGLLLLGLILLFRSQKYISIKERLLIQLFDHLAADLERLVGQSMHSSSGLLNPGPHPMVCSQFVFSCFQKAGDAYNLKIVNGDLIPGVNNKAATGTLIDRLRAFKPAPGVPPANGERTASPDDLIRQIYESATAPGKAADAAHSGASPELAQAVERFGRTLLRFTPDRANKTLAPGCGIDHLGELQALFVTPNDLLVNCPSVRSQGELDLLRKDDVVRPSR